MQKLAFLIAISLAALTLSACGQKGPLYLPKSSNSQHKAK